ncbi:hypothetical protein KK062_28275 [Fulvivirgaceae bacterium PWU5]|uniref:Uncharacterized protein n=1 Tax=Dawidia cretensis TaxID=2782350 RepID=A0AAP2E377_9BACT|nr:hypothetical protein [Dawidia cretensis]MBT1712171.1 hypothetical protein [Dawidia cretensis]
MKSILERLRLVDHLTIEMPIEKRDFIDKLTRNVDQGDIGIFLSPFEAFSSSKNEYRGTVTFDSFKIRRRRRLFDMNMSLAVAEGSFTQKDNILVVEATIRGFRRIFIPFFLFIACCYVAFIISFIVSDTSGNMGWFFIPFIFIHATLMLGIPYYIMRRGVSRMKYELERDFYYITR